jgi:hypothetical protein
LGQAASKDEGLTVPRLRLLDAAASKATAETISEGGAVGRPVTGASYAVNPLGSQQPTGRWCSRMSEPAAVTAQGRRRLNSGRNSRTETADLDVSGNGRLLTRLVFQDAGTFAERVKPPICKSPKGGGHSADEFFTPPQLAEIMQRIVAAEPGASIKRCVLRLGRPAHRLQARARREDEGAEQDEMRTAQDVGAASSSLNAASCWPRPKLLRCRSETVSGARG